MIVDGRKIAEDLYIQIKERVDRLAATPRFAVITCAPNFETKKYLELKKKKSEEVGVAIRVVELDKESETADFVRLINESIPTTDGIIVQLPLPTHIDTEEVLSCIPDTHDVDALSPNNQKNLSPVVRAMREIVSRQNILVENKKATVIGKGKLVGKPAAEWLEKEGAKVTVVSQEESETLCKYTENADIIICGAGIPGLLRPPMVKEGVVILDAGTSEDGGELRGDADALCAEKASIFTPVPGGIGPITIATLLCNVVDCAERR